MIEDIVVGTKEFSEVLKTMGIDAVLSQKEYRLIIDSRFPLTPEKAVKIGNAISDALSMARKDPGTVVKISFDDMGEVKHASLLIPIVNHRIYKMKLVNEWESHARFEFDNRSAILLGLNAR